MTTLTPEVRQPAPSALPSKQSDQRRKRLLLIVGAGTLLLAIVIGAFIYAMIAWTTNITSPASTAADHYYAAIKSQQYAHAYSYLDTHNEVFTNADSFTQAATGRDTTAGAVIDYSISNVTTSWNFGQNVANATVHVTRAHQSYDVHLAMKLEGNIYKITSFDSL